MEYFIHFCDTEECREVTRDELAEDIGEGMMEVLEESGSLSSGKTIYEARRQK